MNGNPIILRDYSRARCLSGDRKHTIHFNDNKCPITTVMKTVIDSMEKMSQTGVLSAKTKLKEC
jgi:hypothetical protein